MARTSEKTEDQQKRSSTCSQCNILRVAETPERHRAAGSYNVTQHVVWLFLRKCQGESVCAVVFSVKLTPLLLYHLLHHFNTIIRFTECLTYSSSCSEKQIVFNVKEKSVFLLRHFKTIHYAVIVIYRETMFLMKVIILSKSQLDSDWSTTVVLTVVILAFSHGVLQLWSDSGSVLLRLGRWRHAPFVGRLSM